VIIKTLVENTAIADQFNCEHGLSLYIEANDKKILMDLGATDLFLENAKKMDVNIEDIDCVLISHGHYDHGGGLKKFLEVNDKAKIYIHQDAFEQHYSVKPDQVVRYIGLDQQLKDNKRITFLSGQFSVDNYIEVFANVNSKHFKPKSNSTLLKKIGEEMVQDDFSHEQNFIIREAGTSVLISGCAHNGIVNIVEKYKELKGTMPDYVLGGFHLYSRTSGMESLELIDSIANYFLDTNIKCYTGHCTGVDAYNRMKITMGDQIEYLATGSQIEIKT
jgi:7,8-dihydropterin-6-yl-methyl-4-(beta-D-ribofuranosyl)aminobenzene 5'-phosphate synthase